MSDNKDNLISDAISEEIVEIAAELAKEYGAKNVTVKGIIDEMGVSNRVFYNRFHNIGDVLEIVHTRAVIKMRESIASEIDITKDFFGYVKDIAVKILINTYDVKKQFSQYMFEHDSHSESNRHWWTEKIKEIIETGKSTGQIKDVDADSLSYTIWCFFRGYNADAVNRKLSKEEAIKHYLAGLDFFFEGVKR